jgi:AraC-like DNA-binding protein
VRHSALRTVDRCDDHRDVERVLGEARRRHDARAGRGRRVGWAVHGRRLLRVWWCGHLPSRPLGSRLDHGASDVHGDRLSSADVRLRQHQHAATLGRTRARSLVPQAFIKTRPFSQTLSLFWDIAVACILRGVPRSGVRAIAKIFAVSPRTVERRLADSGALSARTLLAWSMSLNVTWRLERGGFTVKRTARSSGFPSAESLAVAVKRQSGHTPAKLSSAVGFDILLDRFCEDMRATELDALGDPRSSSVQ